MCDKLPPTGDRDRNTPGGIFIEGCMNVREIFQSTIKRVPPLHLMPEEYPLLTPLVEKLLEKDHEQRPSAPTALNEEWFRQGRDGESSWHFAEQYQHYHARSRFASVGITDAYLMDQSEECEMGPVNSVQVRTLEALREARSIILGKD
jgi:serine/threonine protein kinase